MRRDAGVVRGRRTVTDSGEGMDARFDGLDERMRTVEVSMANVLAQIDHLVPLASRIDTLTSRLDRLDGAIRMAMWVVPTTTAAAVALTKLIPWLLHIEQVVVK